MQVPLTGHLREPGRIGERLIGIAATRSFTPPSSPLTVVDRLGVAAAAALAVVALFTAASAEEGTSSPEVAVRECEELWAAGRWSANLVDVDRDAFVDLCARRPGN